MLNPELQKILDAETKRQQETIDLIPSENFSSKAVREAVGSVFMHKYSEGYPGARYYEGNENIDELENLANVMIRKVFKLPEDWSSNVQPLAGSNANLAVYNALLNIGDTIMSMYLPDGGHLSHGWSYTSTKERNDEEKSAMENDSAYYGGKTKISIVSKLFNIVQYKVNKDSQVFDYDEIEKLSLEVKPKLIITGGTAYPRNIDYKRMKAIAEKVGAYYMADVAHEAGLIAAGVLQSPVGIVDVITFTTHKTLRGPKGAVILMKNELAQKINKSVMPGLQGGPHNGTIAGITQALFEADTQEFRNYTARILSNAQILAKELQNFGFNLVSGGTDKHLVLIDLRNKNISGKYLSKALALVNIVSNMNTVPFETGSPLNPSGIRLGTPTVTTRGMGEEEMKEIASIINQVVEIAVSYKNNDLNEFLNQLSNNSKIVSLKNKVLALCIKFPLNI